jgi:hypothetical protein
VRLLITAVRYDVLAQDLSIDLSKMPAIPQICFVTGNMRRA